VQLSWAVCIIAHDESNVTFSRLDLFRLGVILWVVKQYSDVIETFRKTLLPKSSD
jgi:hypothetical protein